MNVIEHFRAPRFQTAKTLRLVAIYEGKEPTWPIHDIDYATAKTYDDVKKPAKPAGMFDF